MVYDRSNTDFKFAIYRLLSVESMSVGVLVEAWFSHDFPFSGHRRTPAKKRTDCGSEYGQSENCSSSESFVFIFSIQMLLIFQTQAQGEKQEKA